MKNSLSWKQACVKVFLLANGIFLLINIFRAHDADEKAMSQQKAINAKGWNVFMRRKEWKIGMEDNAHYKIDFHTYITPGVKFECQIVNN